MPNYLAAIDFSYPLLLLVGLLAAGIPVLLHLLNRIRSPIVPFPTLRFLKITVQKTSRRRQLQQWLLLVLRMALFALLGMAVAGPVIGGGSLAFAYGTILLLLLGLGFVALTVVLITTALDKAKAKSGPTSSEDLVAQTRAQTIEEKQSAITQHNPGRYWGLSAASAVLAIALAGFATYALASSAYFGRGSSGFSGRSTACVIILDNSQSMLVRQDGVTRLQRAQAYIRRFLLDEQNRPAEMAVIFTNPAGAGNNDATALTAEPSTILARFESLEALGRSLPLHDRVDQALALLHETALPNKLLIVMSDFQQEAFSDVETFAKIAETPNTQVALLTLGTPETPDLGITRFEVDSGQPAVGTEINFGADIVNNGATLAPQVQLELLVDDQVAQRLQLSSGVQPGRGGNGGGATAKIAYRLAAPGYHRFGLRLADTPTPGAKTNDYQDALDWNNQRELVLNVKDQIRVLVVGGQDRPHYRTAPYYAMAALAPFAGVTTGAGAEAGRPLWSLAPSYRPVSAVDPRTLGRYDAIFLCDVPQVPAELAMALKTYVNGGKRLIIQAGPGIDAASYNAVLVDKVGLLPTRFTQPIVSAEGARVDYVDTTSGTAVFADLYDSLEPFQRVVVTGRWALGSDAGNVLWKLSDNSPLIVRHPLGAGDIYLMLTVPSSDWSNFSTQPAFVAAMNRMAQGDLGNARALRSVQTGGPIHIAVGSEDPRLRLLLTSPDGKTNQVAPSLQLPPTWTSPPIFRPGVWKWETQDGPPPSRSGAFVANSPGGEADLTKADEEALAATIHTTDPAFVVRTPEELAAHLKRENRSLMPGVLALVTCLLILEALMANRYRPSLRAVVAPETTPSPATPAQRPASPQAA